MKHNHKKGKGDKKKRGRLWRNLYGIHMTARTFVACLVSIYNAGEQ